MGDANLRPSAPAGSSASGGSLPGARPQQSPSPRCTAAVPLLVTRCQVRACSSLARTHEHLQLTAPLRQTQPAGWLDPVVEGLGRALFLPQLSVFPVLYLDPDLSVFQFPPLQSNIGVRRVG